MSDLRGRFLLAFPRLVGPLERSLLRLADGHIGQPEMLRLRWVWLDGLFATISVSFYASFVGLFVGIIAAAASLTAIAISAFVRVLGAAAFIRWIAWPALARRRALTVDM